MIENAVDQAIVSLLKRISGLVVLAGMQDNEPPLQTAWCAVYSHIERFQGRVPIYELLTTIEYQSISGQDPVSSVQNVMGQIDALLLTQPSDLTGLAVAPFVFLGWESIPRTQQDVGDRRKNIRELSVFAQMQ